VQINWQDAHPFPGMYIGPLGIALTLSFAGMTELVWIE
jgi:hypothetical protein